MSLRNVASPWRRSTNTPFGNPAIPRWPWDRKLCVPVLLPVCPGRTTVQAMDCITTSGLLPFGVASNELVPQAWAAATTRQGALGGFLAAGDKGSSYDGRLHIGVLRVVWGLAVWGPPP